MTSAFLAYEPFDGAPATSVVSAAGGATFPEATAQRLAAFREAPEAGAAAVTLLDPAAPAASRAAVHPTAEGALALLGRAREGQCLAEGSIADRLSTTGEGGRGRPLIELGSDRLSPLAPAERLVQLWPADRALGIRRDPHEHNLPVEPTPFVGRAAELAELASLLAEHRMVTIVGPGGAGKTRLAMRAAAERMDAADVPVWWVPLSDVHDGAAVAEAIARAAGFDLPPAEDPVAVVAALCEARRGLLVLDTCEHLAESVRTVVQAVLDAGVAARVLCSSRQPIATAPERAWPLPALSLPSDDASVAEVATSDGVALFVAAASRADGRFVLDGANAMAVATLVRRLDGLALPIEIAAARCRTFDVAEIVRTLGDRLAAAQAEAGTAARFRTLDESLAWSVELLQPGSRSVLAVLAAFRGGARTDDLEAVAADAGLGVRSVADELERLVAQSMVVRTPHRGGARFGLLDGTREFALRRLLSERERSRLALAHAEHFAAQAAVRCPTLESDWSDGAFTSVIDELDNHEQAFDSFGQHGRHEDAALVLWHLRNIWKVVDSPTIERLAPRTLAFADDLAPAARSRLLLARSEVRSWVQDARFADDLADCLALAVAEGDREVEGRVRMLGAVAKLLLSTSEIVTDLDHAELLSLSVGDVGAARYNRFCRQVIPTLYRMDIAAGPRSPQLLRRVIDECSSPVFDAWGRAILSIDLAHRGQGDEAAEELGRAWERLLHLQRLCGPARGSALRASVLWSICVYAGFYTRNNDAPVGGSDLATGWAPEEAAANGYWLAATCLSAARGAAALQRGDVVAAHDIWTESHRLALQHQLLTVMSEVAMALCDTSLILGDLDQAEELLGTGQTVQYRSLHRCSGDVEIRDGLLALARGEEDAAVAAAGEALERIDAAFASWEASVAIELIAVATVRRGARPAGARLLGAAEALRERGGFAPHLALVPVTGACWDEVTASLGRAGAGAVRDAGRALTTEAAIELAGRAHRSRQDRPVEGWFSLTPAEQAVARLAAAGRTNGEIASEHEIGTETVKSHLARSYAKLGIRNRTELAAIVHRDDA